MRANQFSLLPLGPAPSAGPFSFWALEPQRTNSQRLKVLTGGHCLAAQDSNPFHYCYHGRFSMVTAAQSKGASLDRASLLARRIGEALLRERIVPRFVDSYVVEHGRYGLQVHASLYKDLLTLLQREALLAMCAQALDLVSKGAFTPENRKSKPMARKDAVAFRRKFLAALTRQQHWNAGTALEFQSDLKMYEDILSRAATQRRRRKPFEAANHPFVDRCAFLLDSSFLENARLAASRALAGLEDLTGQITAQAFHQSDAQKTIKGS